MSAATTVATSDREVRGAAERRSWTFTFVSGALAVLMMRPSMRSVASGSATRGVSRSMTTSTEGWSPSARIVGDRIVFEPEFDGIDVEILMAVKEIDADTCPGCGGYLSETTVADHGYHIERKQCTKCAAMSRYNEAQDKVDEKLHGTSHGEIPAARRLYLHRIPLPSEPAE